MASWYLCGCRCTPRSGRQGIDTADYKVTLYAPRKMRVRSRFTTITAEFEALRKELEQTNDLLLLKTLLIEHRAKLAVIEKSLHEEPTALN